MKKLPIDLDDLITAMQTHLDEATHYLDTETGKIELIDHDLLSLVEDEDGESGEDAGEEIEEDEGEESDEDEAEEDQNETDARIRLPVPDWQKGDLPIARAIAAEDPRYVPLPEPDPHEDHRLMSRFAAGVEDPHARQRLEDALDGRGAFSRFRRVIGDYPKLRDEWHACQDAATREEALEWLAELGIEAAEKREGA
jgi:hypothetical protein